LPPATIPIRRGSERYTQEPEVIESIEEKTSVAETILKAILKAVATALNTVLNAVAAALIEKASIDESMPAGEGCADKAVSTWYEHAPASEHATSGHAAAPAHHGVAAHAAHHVAAATHHVAATTPPPRNAMAGVATTIAAAIAVAAMQPRSLVFMTPSSVGVGTSRILFGSGKWETMPECQAAGRSSGDVSVGSPLSSGIHRSISALRQHVINNQGKVFK
jgi:hypothetical protein